MQESDDDLDPLVSSGIIFLCIVCGQLIVTTVIIGIVVTLYRSGHIFACFIGKRFQIIKFSRKIQRCKILKSAVQLIQITEKFIGGIFGCRVYVVDLGIYIGDLGTKESISSLNCVSAGSFPQAVSVSAVSSPAVRASIFSSKLYPPNHLIHLKIYHILQFYATL